MMTHMMIYAYYFSFPPSGLRPLMGKYIVCPTVSQLNTALRPTQLAKPATQALGLLDQKVSNKGVNKRWALLSFRSHNDIFFQ